MSIPVDTIFALGTGAGKAAIAVVRLSGPGVRGALVDFAQTVPEPRVARLVELQDPQNGETLDRGLAFFFPGPHSATGEDYGEFHLHGGRAVVDGVLAALARRPGLRPAEPGEFVRRGFANGKLDLSQAEALADLIDAQTDFQRRQALRIAGGALRVEIEIWRAAIVQALALVEAELDFSDETDVGAAPAAPLAGIISPMLARMVETLQQAPASERLREGFLVLILGAPNAGKSTLINALARRELAIVSAAPGTTRDMIEAHLDIGGMPVTVVDTAGLRAAGDDIERIGVARVLSRTSEADMLLWLSDCGAAPPPDIVGAAGALSVATKVDLHPAPAGWLGVSGVSGVGLDSLLAEIAKRAGAAMGDGASALIIRERHRRAIEAAAEALRAALVIDKPLEIVADDLRAAGRALGRIVGAIDVEDVLDQIFSRFCIGK